MRSSSSSSHDCPPPARKLTSDGFLYGPCIYPDTTDEARTSRPNRSFTERSPAPSDLGPLTFRSLPNTSSRSAKKKSIHRVYIKDDRQQTVGRKHASKVSKNSKQERPVVDSSDEEEKAQITDAELRREKSDYEKRKRDKIIELGQQAEKDHDKLLQQRTVAEQTTREIESSMAMEQDVRDRSMATMKKQLEGMDWRASRDLKDVRKEMDQWKEKTAMSGELAERVDKVEQRVDALEKTDAERKKTMELVAKNWADFGRLKTQSMALEITQIKNRRGAAHLARMPKDVAESTAKNLYKLCADLHRLTFHLNHKSDLTRLVDEALTLAEAIAPLYGAKENFTDSHESSSSTNVSLSALVSTPTADSTTTTASSSGTGSGSDSAPTSPTSRLAAPIRSSLRRVGRDPANVTIPPQSKFDPKYSQKDNLYIDAPSLREKSSNYYSDKEFSNLSKETAHCEPVPVVPQVEATVAAPPPTPAAPANLPAAQVAVPPPAPPVQQPAAEPAAAAPEIPIAAAPTETPPAAVAPAPQAAAPEAPAAPPAAPAEAPAAAAAAADASVSVDSSNSDSTAAVAEQKDQKKGSSRRRSSSKEAPPPAAAAAEEAPTKP